MQDDSAEHVVSRLRARFPDSDPTEVADLVHTSLGRLSQAPVQDFVPLFAEREVRRHLTSVGSHPVD